MAQAAADVFQDRLVLFAVETGIWLLTILKSRMAPEALVTGLVKENRELARILSASIRTAQAKSLQRQMTNDH